MARYRLSNDNKFVEFPRTEEGLKKAKEYRKSHPEFKRRKIKEILQMKPDEIEIGKEYFFS